MSLRPWGGGGDSCLWEFTRICHYSCFRSSCSKIRCDFGFIMSSLREAFVSRLRVGVMEQASGSTMTGIRAFSAHLPLTSLLLFYYCCGPLLLFGSPSTIYYILWLYSIAIAIAFQVNTGVSYFLDYVQDIYDGGPLCPV